MIPVINDYRKDKDQHFRRKEEVKKDERDVTDKIIIITGCNHGIGHQTALELAKRGARVVMACRDLTKAEAAKEYILKEVPNGKLEVVKLDLGEFNGAREFSNLIHAKFDHVDVLINNAGMYKFDGKIRRTNDGFEEHMGVNHLNPFLLTLLLLDLLAKSERSRIVCVASTFSLLQEFNVNDLNMENFKKFGVYAPYANSKMANILFMRELARRLGENSNINCYAICPGMVNIERVEDQSFLRRFLFIFAKYWGFLDLENVSDYGLKFWKI
ncbi:unnamed protein product [Allacma fusca]|uniref:Uncharacterized protein n=1 Tax=Allacma fusca TaxID=39272 RepID=A0A8J2PPY7_9HEXA|nr:unnamed protein product [Allacma fusca]